jgi:hypothetical protein
VRYTENVGGKMQINKDWHMANKMPKNPTIEQRIEWHLAHAKNCICRPLGGKILEEINKRKLEPKNA